jgi:hypothetical protein
MFFGQPQQARNLEFINPEEYFIELLRLCGKAYTCIRR